MSFKILDRKNYDVRFLKIPMIPERRIQSFIQYRMNEIYPGHSTDFPFYYRVYKNKKDINYQAVIIFLKNIQIPEKHDSNYGCLTFFLPELLTQLEDDWSGSVLLFHDSCVECITIKNGLPTFSRVVREPSKCENPVVVYFTEPDQQTPEFPRLKKPKDWKKVKLTNTKKSSPARFRQIIILSTAAVILLFGVLNLYENIQNDYLEFLSVNSKQKQQIQYDYTKLEEKIKSLTEGANVAGTEPQTDPYIILSVLYREIGGLVEIESLQIENNAIRLEGTSKNPMQMTEKLSENPLFSGLAVENLIPSENIFHFTLRGSINEQ